MASYRVYWTQEASRDLEEIFDYIAGENCAAAISLFRKIERQSQLLKTHPVKFRIVPELAGMEIKGYRENIHKPYRILYKCAERNVYVLAVVDSRRDFETLIFHRLIRSS